jgi:hypothetical protein
MVLMSTVVRNAKASTIKGEGEHGMTKLYTYCIEDRNGKVHFYSHWYTAIYAMRKMVGYHVMRGYDAATGYMLNVVAFAKRKGKIIYV